VDPSGCKEGHQEPELGILMPNTHYMEMSIREGDEVSFGTLLPELS